MASATLFDVDHRASVLVGFVGSLEAPIVPGQLSKEMKQRYGWKPATVKLAVAESLAAGTLHNDWPRKAIWYKPAAEGLRMALLAAGRKQALPEAKLAKSAGLKGGSATKALIAGLIEQRLLRTAGKLLYAADSPAALIGAVLEPKLAELAAFGVSRGDIAAYFGAAGTAPAAETDLPARVLEAVTRLQPGPSVPVTVQEVRAALPAVDKAAFDEAVMHLARRQKLRLVVHDHGWGLSEREREQLVAGGGSYYGAMTVREEP